jgi:hypothetical protein
MSGAAAILVAALSLSPTAALAQGAVLQSGTVVPGHVVVWGRSGVIMDGGTVIKNLAFLPLTGGTLTGNLIVNGSGAAELDVSGNVNVNGPGPAQLIINGGAAITGGNLLIQPPTSSTNDANLLQSTYNVGYVGGAGSRIHFNSVVDTHIASVPGDSIWNFLAQLSTTTGTASIFGTKTQVASYAQAVRNAITGGAKGVALEGSVTEYHDLVDAPTSVRGFGVTAEFDFAANGADDAGVTGVLSLDLSQANLAGSDNVVGNGVGIFGNSHAYLQRAIMVGTPFSQAGFDTRQATQMTGAHAIWLADGQDIALSSDGTMNITRGIGGTMDFHIGGVAMTVSTLSEVTAPGGFNASGGVYKVGAVQVVGARNTGWGVATGGDKSAFTAGSATLGQTAAAVAAIINALTAHGLIGP